jgi:hypothetical protein
LEQNILGRIIDTRLFSELRAQRVQRLHDMFDALE